MDRAEAIRKLIPVFRQYGYDGATLAQISKATGLGRASLYHHFPGGKKEMAEAVLQYVGQWFKANVLEPLEQDAPLADRLAVMNKNLRQFYNCGQDACLLALFSVGESDRLFHEVIQRMLEGWIGAIAHALQEAGLSADEATILAEDAVIHIQGALVVTRGLNRTEAFERVLQKLPEQLRVSAA